jgi:hypothetical protein
MDRILNVSLQKSMLFIEQMQAKCVEIRMMMALWLYFKILLQYPPLKGFLWADIKATTITE